MTLWDWRHGLCLAGMVPNHSIPCYCPGFPGRSLLWRLYFYKLDKFCHLSFYLILKWILDTENIQHFFKFLLTVKNVSKYFKVISDNNFIVHRQQFYQFKAAWKRWPYFGLKFWSKIQIFSGVGSNLQGSAVICREKLN